MNKHILKDEHIDIDWARQRVQINERIDAAEHARRPAWRWAIAVASAAMIALVAWLGVHQLQQHEEIQDNYAALEQDMDEFIRGRIPGALMVLNGWTDIETENWNAVPTVYDPFDLNSTDSGNGTGEEAL